MVVGNAISKLIDPEDKRMSFSGEEVSGLEGLWYQELPTIHDTATSIECLKPTFQRPSKTSAKSTKTAKSSDFPTKARVPADSTSKIISIEEVDDGLGSEDEDLPMYAKPYSDVSDEDEDPNLIQRDKPTAPV